MEETKDWPVVAICYDFDKTLSPKDMQEFGLIPKLGCGVSEFWNQSNGKAKEHKMDKILMYMKLILDMATLRGIKIAREDFNELGTGIELFPGVDSWFQRINKKAESLKIKLEHYIISAGLKEIVEGTSIAKFFTGIYASEFYYDEYGRPVWPGQVVNYTTKTQYLFRINKNCLDLGDEDSVNQYIPKGKRRIPLTNFIYIGDSETDIPAMKIVKQGGGTSIGVYNPEKCNIERVTKLIKQNRIDYLMPADYTENSKIENVVNAVLNEIHTKFELDNLHSRQMSFVDRLENIDHFIEYTDRVLSEENLALDEIDNIEKQFNKIIRDIKRNMITEHANTIGEAEIKSTIARKQEIIKEKIREAREKINKTNTKLLRQIKK